MKYITIYICFFVLISCDTDRKSELINDYKQGLENDESNFIDEEQKENIESLPNYSNEVFFTEGAGWGYRILIDGKVHINQPHIPAVSGNQGFTTKEKAQITADFALSKVEKGNSLPTISPAELDSLGVLD